MSAGRKTKIKDDCIALARCGLHRAVRKVRVENVRLGLPLIVAKNGKPVGEPA